jgi:glutaredoxin/glutathione-dependent peroxiredoxin
MTIKIGDQLPDATLFRMGEKGVEQITTATLTKGRRVALFGLPGAYTGTCSTMHVPSFMRTAAAFRAKGVDEIVCVATDTPHVMAEWGKTTGGADAGITFLSDGMSAFTTAIGMSFDVPAIGFANRSKRYSMLIEDGQVTQLNPEPPNSQCEISAGETLLAQIS